jgi:hypothetical protein
MKQRLVVRKLAVSSLSSGLDWIGLEAKNIEPLRLKLKLFG